MISLFIMISEYLVAWHGMANGDSQQELEFLFRDKDLHTAAAAVSQVVSPTARPVGRTGTVISPISAFSLSLFLSLPPTVLADRGFYGISSGSGHTFFPVIT